jgi:bifunctional non-homologous end joining protein LigD
MGLTKYHQKRRFNDTPEPAGKLKKARTRQLEFVVQKHNASRLHYDFRLELGGVLKSWAVPKGPSLNPQDRRLAVMVEDHPYEYRKFEGDIPKGNYGAGQVIIWDRGTYQPRVPTDQPEKLLAKELADGHLTFIMHGQKLKGEFALIRNKRAGDNAWLLIKKSDNFATTDDVTEQISSVVSGETIRNGGDSPQLNKAPNSPRPTKVKPMLATLTDEPFDDKGWVYEIKWDGYRAIGSWDGQDTGLYSRNGLDFSQKYPAIKEALRALKKPAVIDGEVVVLDESGNSKFELLQNYGLSGGDLAFYAFDALWCEGKDLTGLPLEERKQVLEAIIPGRSIIRYSGHIKERGKDFFAAAVKNKLEGIMAKDAGSKYRQGIRAEQWLKIKTHLRQEAVICGFTEPRGSRRYIGALILGVYKGDKLTYVGHAGGGGNIKLLKELRQKLEKMQTESSPFEETVRPNAPVHWVKPRLLCEVSFAEWTKDGRMRQPIFKGIRADKPAKEVSMEKPKPAARPNSPPKMEFSNLDKVFWPEKGYTKGDLIDYYRKISGTILPYIKDRPHNLLRQPNGYRGKSFFQKDVGDLPPYWVKTVKVYSESNQKKIDYLVCDSVDSLLYMAQLGCIEINPWNSRVDKLDKPDWVVLDLDPEDVPFNQVVEVANVVRLVTEDLNIASYPKTSGKTGIHIYIPLGGRYDYEQARSFAEILAHLAHRRTDSITSLERSPAKRQKRIYIDFLQNREGQTLAAPYSVRPTPEATVSAPLRWDELTSGLRPTAFTIKTIAERLDKVGDLWRPVMKESVDIAKALKRMA